MEKEISINIRFPKNLHARFKAYAKGRRLSINSAVLFLVEEVLGDAEKKKPISSQNLPKRRTA